MRFADASWTPARWYLLAIAITHIPLGVIGLVMDRSFPIGPEAAARADSAMVFGVFETNGWHSLAALGIGVGATLFTMYPSRARAVALALGVSHVAIMLSFSFADPTTKWIASNGADQVIHASTAIGGIATGLLTRPDRSRMPRRRDERLA